MLMTASTLSASFSALTIRTLGNGFGAGVDGLKLEDRISHEAFKILQDLLTTVSCSALVPLISSDQTQFGVLVLRKTSRNDASPIVLARKN